MKVLSLIVLLAIVGLFSCKKDNDPILFSNGEYELKNGTCTPYCIITLSNETLTWEGIDYSGSTDITYVEIYKRSSSDANKYIMVDIPTSYVTIKSESSFTFTSSVRTCEFGR